MSAYGLTRDQNVDLLVKTALEYGITDHRQLAYIVATAQHETANFDTSREYDGPNQAIRNGYSGGENYYGRGYVQVTHDTNYDRMATVLGDSRIRTNPDIVAQEATLGAQTTVVGMARGLYTGVGLDRYINSQGADYTDARRIVNGTDRADLIAGYARNWEQQMDAIVDRVTAQGLTPRAMPGSPMADGSLSRGESGPEVARMQEALRQQGFNITPDGIYGGGTQGIVQQYQQRNGLPATGTADAATLERLGVTQVVPIANNPGQTNPGQTNPSPTTPAPTTPGNTPTPTDPATPAPTTPAPTAPAPTAPSNSAPQVPAGVYREGDTGDGVRALQEALRRNGAQIEADGRFGPLTKQAVESYQRQNGLDVDGVAGAQTIGRLNQAPQQTQPAPAPTAPATPTTPTTPTTPSAPEPANGNHWPTPGNFTVNRADKPGEGGGEFGEARSGGRQHRGIDINGSVGDPIEPMRAGRVTFAGNGGAGAGNMIIVDHGNGLETRYLHLDRINVREGQQVTEDTVIGTMGRTGNTPRQGDTHLHFEVRENGAARDPRLYLNFPDRAVLQEGDQGRDVIKLQEALRGRGATIEPDGDFGPATKRAVETFQRANGLEPDGIAGPDTQRTLGMTQQQANASPVREVDGHDHAGHDHAGHDHAGHTHTAAANAAPAFDINAAQPIASVNEPLRMNTPQRLDDPSHPNAREVQTLQTVLEASGRYTKDEATQAAAGMVAAVHAEGRLRSIDGAVMGSDGKLILGESMTGGRTEMDPAQYRQQSIEQSSQVLAGQNAPAQEQQRGNQQQEVQPRQDNPVLVAQAAEQEVARGRAM